MNALEISDSARNDLIEIWEYLSDINERAADRVVDEITVAFETIAAFPTIG